MNCLSKVSAVVLPLVMSFAFALPASAAKSKHGRKHGKSVKHLTAHHSSKHRKSAKHA